MLIIKTVLALLLFINYSHGTPGRPAFTAQVVENLVQKEIARKMPAAASHRKKSLAGKDKILNGVHLKEATDAINKLVDESIVDRVQEAEKEVSQMLLRSIEHHIQDAGKVLLKQDENTCRDKFESCPKLAEAGVCESSKAAMVVDCPETCNFCSILEDMKSKEEAKKENEEKEKKKQEETEKLQKQEKEEYEKIEKIKNIHNKNNKTKHNKKKTKTRKHKKKHLTIKSASALAPEEMKFLHENLLDQNLDHANLPMAVNTAPVEIDTSDYEPRTENADEEQKEGEEQETEKPKEYSKKKKLDHQKLEKEKQEQKFKAEEEKKRKQELEKKKKKAVAKKIKQQQQQQQQQQQEQQQQEQQQEIQQQNVASDVGDNTPIAANTGNDINGDNSGEDSLEDPNSQIQYQQQFNEQQQQVQQKTVQAQNVHMQKQQQNQVPVQPAPNVAPITDYAYGGAGSGFSTFPYSKYTGGKNDEHPDMTETDVVNRDKQEEDNHAKKRSKQKILSKFINTNLKKSSHKTDAKLKHEIETMVDKAFGELLLK